MSSLFPALTAGGPDDDDRPALRFGDRALTYGGLRSAAAAVVPRLAGAGRVAVWATPSPETCVAVVAALLAGVPAVPLNPRTGERELTHIVGDSAPALVLAAPGDELPAPLAGLPRVDVTADAPDGAAAGGPLPAEPDPGAPALVVYTSGTTGPPKGAVLPRRALATTLDALADAWAWTADDVLVHALPLFHVHGLVLGVLGPLRRGGAVRHLGRFTTDGVARALADGGTMLFGVPTMYHRIAEALAPSGSPTANGSPGGGDAPSGGTDAAPGTGSDPRGTDAAPGAGGATLARALAGARLLVSGSAALPLPDHERITAATGRRVVERYGMTETLMNTSVRPGAEPERPGSVGTPLPGVELRLVLDDGTPVTAYDGETIGEVQVRGPHLFTEYLNRPDATAAAFDGDWFRTGDMAVRDADGSVRLVGRRATDLIKSGGFKIGAGEIENALLAHPAVREAAVTGEPDPDLGERVVAWVVATDPGAPPPAAELADHVAAQLAPHKRPRAVRYLDALPRNDMGKVLKRALHG
ncbi:MULTISPECIES: acyl-CoA synthetase [Streptomyces]|uniref:Acyl-CoA synthetase n=2 Tax=Streptomyces TaxID=1883 RepID=A0A117IWQ0_9ACTN|nr:MULTISPECIES: acyl-CoA synthetase [Streptomyces]KUH38513.1 acyl-CoA synthetase [Streptomyces kanasensis]UUS30921.1 acyl-CoA synthetase [Streptomyces changanensis]